MARSAPPLELSLHAHPRLLAQPVELFFSILTRRLLRRGTLTSKADLKAQLLAFLEHYNPTAKPFAWTYEGKPLHVNGNSRTIDAP